MIPCRKLAIITLTFAVVGAAGCAQSKVATILGKDNSQLALALNKDGSVTVVGVGAGERVKPCKVPANPLVPQEAGKTDVMPDDKAIAQCFPEGHVPGKILFQQTYTITVREGSLCADVQNGGIYYVYCSPPYPLAFVKANLR